MLVSTSTCLRLRQLELLCKRPSWTSTLWRQVEDPDSSLGLLLLPISLSLFLARGPSVVNFRVLLLLYASGNYKGLKDVLCPMAPDIAHV